MFGISPLEMAAIALLAVLLFGHRRLPELGSGLGHAISNFRKAFREGNAIDVTPQSDEKKQVESDPPKAGGSDNKGA